MPDGDSGGEGYTIITLPGVQDVFAVPPLESDALKRERLTRWRINAQRTTIPEPLRWLPQLINYVDDAQDTLITALIIGKPVLRLLPSRFIPYLGWALLANDALNLFTGMLSAPLNPRSLKADFLATTRRAVAGRTARVRAAEAFLLPGRVKFIPFLITAGQVLYSYTGWGLRLGTVMGAVSETFWGLLRSLHGERVVIHGPPPSDPAAKAARFLMQSYNWNALAQVANDRELLTVTLAQNLAMALLGAPAIAPLDDLRLQTLADMTCPLFEVWSPTSQQALTDAAFPPLNDQRVPTPTVDDFPRVGDAVRVAIASAPDLDVTAAEIVRQRWNDWPAGMMASEAAKHTWDVFGAGFDVVVPLNSPMERMLGLALEAGLAPPFLATPTEHKVRYLMSADSMDPTDGWIANPTQLDATKWIHGWHFPIAYPPPSDDPNAQIAHWCAIALAMYCHRHLAIPRYERADFQGGLTIAGWTYTTARDADHITVASILVWGNIWRRASAPEPFTRTGEKKKKPVCVPNATGYVSLSGTIPDDPPLQMILDALPPPNTPPARTGQRNDDIPRWRSRDWLDDYMKHVDPRRQTGPQWPSVDALPEPQVDWPAWWLPLRPPVPPQT